MEQQYPSKLLGKAVEEFSRLPGIGRKTALRLVLFLLRSDTEVSDRLAEAITTLRHEVKYCRICHNISDTDVCDICANPRRDSTTICVVENVQDVMVEGIGPGDIEIESLVERVKAGGIREVILAMSPTMEGDTTNFYISRRLAGTGVRLTVISRGVAVGDELEYADEVTLGRSIINRTDFNN